MFLPYHYNERKTMFYTKGVFCSFPCMKRYNIDRHHAQTRQKVAALISFMSTKFHGGRRGEPVHAAPPLHQLQKFGGSMHLSEYRGYHGSSKDAVAADSTTNGTGASSSRVIAFTSINEFDESVEVTTCGKPEICAPSATTRAGSSVDGGCRGTTTNSGVVATTTTTTSTSRAYIGTHPSAVDVSINNRAGSNNDGGTASKASAKPTQRFAQAASKIKNATRNRNFDNGDSLRLKRQKRIESNGGNKLMSENLLKTLGIEVGEDGNNEGEGLKIRDDDARRSSVR